MLFLPCMPTNRYCLPGSVHIGLFKVDAREKLLHEFPVPVEFHDALHSDPHVDVMDIESKGHGAHERQVWKRWPAAACLPRGCGYARLGVFGMCRL